MAWRDARLHTAPHIHCGPHARPPCTQGRIDMSHNLQPGDLKLPFADGAIFPITSLFKDPRRGSEGWDPDQRHLHIHEGIDWGCKTGTPVYAMAEGVVTEVIRGENAYGNHVVVRTGEEGAASSFTLTYAHMDSVTVEEDALVYPFKSNLGEGENIALGTSGNTGNSTADHLHVHFIPNCAKDNLKGLWNRFRDFQQYLPEGHYHWPDIEALRDIINDSGLISKIDDPDRDREITNSDLFNKNRDLLGEHIDQWMDNLLRGWKPNEARLWVKPGGKVYRFPKVDDQCEYPGRPTPGVAIVGRGNVVSEPRHSDTDARRPDWWRIKGNSFPACWVRDEDVELVGNWQDVSVVSSSLPEDPPRYLQKGAGTNVRSGPNTHRDERHEEVPLIGKLMAAENTIVKRVVDGETVWATTGGDVVLDAAENPIAPVINGWVPILELKPDETTKDYLWYKIPYDSTGTATTSNAEGWVRGDVVEVQTSLLTNDKKAFPGDTAIPVPFPACAIPCVETAKGKRVPALPYPDEESRNPNTLTYAIEGVALITGCSENSPLWYQLQLTDTRRGWVLADQVTAHNAGGLHQVQPRLRRRLGSPAAIPVRNGPVDTGTVLAAIGAADRAWHALRGRDAAYPGWWRTRYDGPVAGWVRSDQVRTHGSLAGLAATWNPAPQLSLRSTTALGLNVRSGPGTGHAKVGFIRGGSTDRYDILGKDAATATWWQIRYSPAVVGWVHGGYVRTHGSLAGLTVTSVPQLSLGATATNGLTVRSGPGTTHGQVGLIAAGSTDRYDILGKDADTAAWYQIRFDTGVTGWVDRDEVRTHGDLTGLTVTAVPQLSLKPSTTDGLRVRSGPGTTHGQVASIAGGSTTKYDILGQDAAAATWYQIRFSDSLDGWVHGDYVQFHGDLTGLGVTWVPQLSLKATAANGLAIHAGPGTTHDQTGFITTGSTDRYDILGKDADTPAWYQVRHRAFVDGWVKADDAVETDGCLDLSPPPRAGLAAAAQNCAVRDAPAPTGTVRATITDRAERYPVLAKDADTPAWYEIRFSDSISGWVQASCVQLHGDGRNLPIAGTPTTDNRPRLSLASATTAGLNLRTGPGEGHRILLTLPFNTTRYDILGKDADAAAWYEIRYGQGISGWVSEPHVQTHGSLDALTVTWNPAPQLGLPTGAAYGLNVRSGPAETRDKVGLITAGSTVRYDILGQDADAPGWYQIRFGDTIGWVHAGYVQTHGDLDGLGVTWVPQLSLNAAAATGQAVYFGPGFGHTQVGFIAAGSTVRYDILGRDAPLAAWYQIRYDASVTGWVPASRVQTHGDLDGLSATWRPQLSLDAAPYGLYVRSGPGRGHDPLGVITAGSTDRYDILGQNAATATWYQIRYGDTAVGWVSADHVQTYGSLAGLAVTWVPQLNIEGTRTLDLNVHAGPGATHDRVGSITAGSSDRYDILGKDADTAAWYEIRFSATVTGWVAAAHVQTHGGLAGLEATWNPTPRLLLKAETTLGLNVRSGPDRTHNRIGFIKGGSTVEYEILGKNAATATWYRIRYRHTLPGWVSADHVQARGDLTGLRVAWSADPQLNIKGTNTIDLNVRAGPDATHDRIGRIKVGSTVRYDILGKDAATAAWYQIRFGVGVDGWVSAAGGGAHPPHPPHQKKKKRISLKK
ncbi:MAG: SH3 domain-containing protein [Caldilineaceae bacterium SB0662_bin_9]|uniref:SH3 domain-containing protein n=1 Tax=Caldilineaceae bacterium SB0662_bin_9 TaxID=2605258 RepID=A0A6B1DR94_9CHLR|nr:SH3 domain-containing protein [Caldilineaceae bacterium SB0662_bin_9]